MPSGEETALSKAAPTGIIWMKGMAPWENERF